MKGDTIPQLATYLCAIKLESFNKLTVNSFGVRGTY